MDDPTTKFLRVRRPRVHLNQIHVTEDRIEYEWICQHHAVIGWDIRRGKRIKRIRDDGRA